MQGRTAGIACPAAAARRFSGFRAKKAFADLEMRRNR
jgi:hypothetical protein